MKRSIYSKVLAGFLLILMIGCTDDEVQTSEIVGKVNARYVEEVCCSNIILLENTVLNPYSNEQDSLIMAVNIEAFEIPQKYQFGDTFFIEFEETTNENVDCNIICNRHNGVPVKLLSVE